MDKELMNRINEAMKEDEMLKLRLEDLNDVSGGGDSSELCDLLVAANKACKEELDFEKEMCRKYGMSDVKKAILTNQLSREEQEKWLELRGTRKNIVEATIACGLTE